MKKSELRQIIREEIQRLNEVKMFHVSGERKTHEIEGYNNLINEIDYAPLPTYYADRLRSLGSAHEAPLTKKVGKTGLSIAKRRQVRDKIGRVESELSELRREFADLNFEMEQLAEPEGGREAERIGTKLEKVLNKINKKESELNELRRKLL